MMGFAALSPSYNWKPAGSVSRLAVAAQKLPDALDNLALRVDRRHRPGAGQGIAGKKALIEDLAAAKGVAGDVPGQAEELHPLAGLGVVGREILLDIGLQRAFEILLAWGQQEARRAQELQDFDHARIAIHHQITGAFDRQDRRAHDTPAVG